jgi:hypothetical protein
MKLEDRKPLKMEVYVPTMEFLRHERRIKDEDYKKLDKLKNVSSLYLYQSEIDIHSSIFSRR